MSGRLYTTVYAADDLPTTEAEIASKSLGTVDVWSELEYKHPLHGTGALRGKINRHHAQAALLQKDRYVLVHSDAGPIGGAFLDDGEIDLSSEQGPGDEWATWTGKGQIFVMDRANMDATSNISGGHNPIDGFWDLDEQGPLAGAQNAHPIPMAKRVIVEAQLNTPNAIGMVDHSSWDYDSDSAAAAVPFLTGDFGADVGESLYELFGYMSQIGGVVWQMSYLFALNAYLTFGTDRSGAFGAATVRFEKGVNVTTKIQRKVRGSVHKTHLIVGGADRTFVTVTDPDYVSGDVVRWGFLSMPESSDTDALTAAGLAHIALRKRQTDVWTFPLHDHGDDPANGIYEPAPDIADGHFWVGDTASIHTGTGEYDANEQAAPIAAITWVLKTGPEANGDYAVIIEIGSTFHWDGVRVLAGSSVTGSQHRFLLCAPGTAASEVSLVNWTWDAGVAEDVPALADGQPASQTHAPVDGPEWYIDDLPGGTEQALPSTSAHAACLVSAGRTYRIAGRLREDLAGNPLVRVHWLSDDYDGAARTILSTDTFQITGAVSAWVEGSESFVAPVGAVAVQFGQGGNTQVSELSFAGITAGTPGDGHPDLVGTASRAARCNHRHDVHRDTAPTVNDDASAGYKLGTIWAQLDSLAAPTEIVGTWMLVDATDGAAVWLSMGGGVTDHGALTGLEDDDHPQYVRTTLGGKEVVNTVAASGAAETLDLANGNWHDVTLTANCTFTFAGATNGVGCSFVLILRQDGTGSRTVTWPGSVIWPGDVAPTLSTDANAVDVLSFLSNDGGTTWFGTYPSASEASSGSLPLTAVVNGEPTLVWDDEDLSLIAS